MAGDWGVQYRRYFPYKRLTVNLAPANARKTGPIYGLPIAIGILAATCC